MSIREDFKNSLSGNIESAMLTIHDFRSGGTPSVGKEAMKTTATALKSGVPPTYPNSQNRTLKVQFNPSKLLMNAAAVPKVEEDVSTGTSRVIAAGNATLNLTVILYFDDMDTYDAFMWEKFTAGLSTKGLVNLGKGVADLAGKGKVHSVQWQVEALIAALRDRSTRKISFCWSDFVFTGELSTVRANYTMFSTSGRPIRAEVLLRIQHLMGEEMMEKWKKQAERAFGGDNSNLVTVEQNFETLLNLNL